MVPAFSKFSWSLACNAIALRYNLTLKCGNVTDMLVEKKCVFIGAVVLTFVLVHKLGFPSCLSENMVIVHSVWRL